MPDDFRHVGNSILRRTLESNPRHIRRPELRQAVDWTVEALGHDVIDDGVSAPVLAARIDAAREATRLLNSRQTSGCHAALCKFWLS